ncbi:MAG: hypothetical protein PHP98_06550 [Kiritimatiellae bacterium]|jgi:hypothetical protein|nr:hypothetical protein [Kiritimatiellia bacterium]
MKEVSIILVGLSAYGIENYDTACLRAKTAGGVEILFVTSHAVGETLPLMSEFIFEKTRVELQAGSALRAVFNDGQTREYRLPASDQSFNKLWQCIEAVRTGFRPVCGPEAARAQTLCMNGAQESMPEIISFPQGMIRRRRDEKGQEYVFAENLSATLENCYGEWKLPSEKDIPWSRPGRRIGLSAYEWYPGGKRAME